MKRTSGGSQGYIPGTYARRTPNGMKLAETKMRDWERQRQGRRAAADTATLAPTICISRKIGVGALEIADLVAERIDYRVVDREILEHIANHAELREKTVAFFDEKYSGRMAEFITLLFGEKSFIKSDYARHLAETVFTVANLEPTVFVGRGAHLILPRDRVLAVRLICGEAHRVGRLCDILGMDAPARKKRTEKAGPGTTGIL